MPTFLFNGKLISEKFLSQLALKVAKLPVPPVLAIVTIGQTQTHQTFLKIKKVLAQKAGVQVEVFHLNPKRRQTELLKQLQKICDDAEFNGIILQLPISSKFNVQKFLKLIPPQKNVDALNPKNTSPFAAPTVLAILEALKASKIQWQKKKILLIGYGNLVGKPLAWFLRTQKIPFRLQKLPNPKKLQQNLNWAEVVISATGQPDLITGEQTKRGSIIIDCGSAYKIENGKKIFCGDVNTNSVLGKAKFLSPSPGGIGRLTVYYLLENTFQAHLGTTK